MLNFDLFIILNLFIDWKISINHLNFSRLKIMFSFDKRIINTKESNDFNDITFTIKYLLPIRKQQ